jgi:hypothetical protein
MKENVIIGRQIPAWRQYRKIQDCRLEDEYFDELDDWVDLSIRHINEVMTEMEDESDF